MTVGNGFHSKPNILLIGIDSLRADHLSCYGYPRLTSPHIDRLASQGTLFENTFSAHIPTTSGYTSMLSGLDVFSSQVVALRHKGPVRSEVTLLPELLKGEGYNTACIGSDRQPEFERVSTHILTIERGVLGKRGVATRHRTSIGFSCPSWNDFAMLASRFSCCSVTWTRMLHISRRSLLSGCFITATNSTRRTSRWSP